MPPTRLIASFDTEDDGKGVPYLFAIVHSKGSWTGSTRESTLEYIAHMGETLRAENAVLELWATNLEYDLVNLFGEARIAELVLRFGKSYLVGAEWRGHNVRFRDTVRHIPQSVKELGKLVGIPKLERKKGTKGNEAYCIRDAAITRRAALWLDKMYSSFGIAPKMTLASSALAIWKDNYWKREVVLPSDEIVGHAKEAYYGGRTEAFAIGSWNNVRAIDVASMFPWAMIADRFPIPWGDFSRYVPGDMISDYGIYRASINAAKVEYPFLPVRTMNGTQYPRGVWEAWYTGHELLFAMSRGYDVQCSEGYNFRTFAEPFKGYVEAFFNLKSLAKGSERTGYKLLLNSLYG